jgi:hypothetical protein
MKIIISPRTTFEWLDPQKKIWDRFLIYEEFWNSHKFNLTYREYRYNLQQIARDNLLDIKNGVVGEPEEGELCIPVDDDDWFSPELIVELEKCIGENDYCYWNSTELCRGQITDGTNHWCLYCKTNNYCFRYNKSVNDVFKNHGVADKEFANRKQSPLYINQKLNMVNRNVGSATFFLGKELEDIDLEGAIEETLEYLREDRIYSNPYIAWAEPYINKYRVLVENL